jgi:hypothetical protein
MSFFLSYIWSNLRKSIRNLGITSNWYIILTALTKIFDSRVQNYNYVKDSLYLNSASGESLNDWGKRYNILRLENESEEDYKSRILFQRSISKSGLSRLQKSRIIESILGLPIFSVKIENGQDRQGFRIGDAIGTGIVSRAYNIFSYTVFISRQLSEEQREKLTNYIELVNIGGNFPFYAELQDEFNIFKTGGEIGSVILSKNQSNNQVYVYY